MMVSLLIYYSLMITFQFSAVSAQTFSFNQPATGPSSVCEGNDVTLQCVIVINPGNIVQSIVWSRNGMPVQVSNASGTFNLPNHNQVFNFTTGVFTDLVITNVTLEDDNTVYSCTATGAPTTSNVILNVTGIPPVENLTAVDNCTSVTVSWDITDEGSCKDLSYNVSLTSRDDGVILQSMMTDDTSYTFSVEPSNEMFSVNVSTFNDNATGPNSTRIATVNAPNDIPSPIGLRTVSRICVTFFNISWSASNRVTCGNVSYNLSVFQSSIEQITEQFTGVDGTFYFSVTGLNNSDPDVMVTVTASNKAGRGNMSISVPLPPSLGLPINDVTASTNDVTNNMKALVNQVTAPSNLSGFDIFIMWTRPVINDPCTTLPVSLYTINASVFMNGTQRNHLKSRSIFDTSGDSMGRFNVSYNDNFDEELVPNATYIFTVNSDNTQLPQTPPTSISTTDPPPPIPDGALIAIIVVCVIIAGVILICAGIAAAYLHMKSKENGDPKKSTKLLKLALFLISLGVGLIILAIWLWKNRKDVLPDKVEMTGQSDLYASPKKINQGDTDNKATQDLYSYARTGPINVVVPGGKP